MSGFLGMRGTGDWTVEGQRPKNWREAVLYLYPNGMAPLTALLSKMGSEKVDDPEFNWYTKTLSQQAAAITGIYTNSGLSVAYTSGGVAGDTLYVRMSAADASEIRDGHQVLFRDAASTTVDKNAKVVDVVSAGANSYAAVKLLEDDNGSGADISDADRLLIVGSINAEGAAMPDAISYDPVKMYNLTQIFRTPLEITRTAKLTRLRTGDAYKELKREALEYHSIEMEKSFLWGIRSENTGTNGKPERTTQGLIPTIRTHAPSNCVRYATWAAAQPTPPANWMAGGDEFLDTMLEQVFRYGGRERLAFCGSGALLGINRLVKNSGQFEFNPSTKAFGIQVTEWITAFGKINLITHPLFSYEPTNRNTMVLFEPQHLKYRFITDTTFYADGEQKNTGYSRRDGLKEEFLTECGLEYHFPSNWAYLSGIGLDS